jgi:hypothetical protein
MTGNVGEISFFGICDMPVASDCVEGLLREGARLDAAIVAGEMTQEEARAVLSSDSLAEMGIAPHIVAEVTSWGNKTTAELATEPQPKADTPAAEPDSADKAAQKPAEPAPQRASAEAPAPGFHRPFADAKPSRETLQQEVAKWEAAMRSPEGSAEWRSYWREGGSQAYGEALRAMEAADTAPALAVCTENLNPGVAVMESAQNGKQCDAPGPLNRARDRRIFIQ